MKEAIYFHDNTVILNYSKKYIKDSIELLSSEGFYQYLTQFLEDLHRYHHDLYLWCVDCAKDEKVEDHLIHLIKQLLVMDIDMIEDEMLEKKDNLLLVIEEGYNYWRHLQRYSFLYTHNDEGFQLQNFIDADSAMNALVLNFYRLLEEKVQGNKNKVYRQLQAGTNASILLEYYEPYPMEGYEALHEVPYINQIMMRTPLILHPKSNKRSNTVTKTDKNPLEGFQVENEDWVCYPAKVGKLLVLAYFQRDHISSAVAMANLFELASQEEAIQKPDCIMLFGVKDDTKDTVYYHDTKNSIWIGKVSHHKEIDYFGYTKKMVLTLHNLAMMEKGWLPIHGAMVNLYLKDGSKKGLLFMGDSGAGKSETIEALNVLASKLIDHQEIVFDDMGSVHMDEDGNILAQGTEIGAFVRLDDLDKGTAYRDMDRSIFFNPEKANARVVLPASSYSIITKDHPIDCFLYANNYTDLRGMKLFSNIEEALPIFIEGKRNALGTTQEKGLSSTFFANPFGPMQEKEKCEELIHKIFHALFEKGIPVGEIYTCLGLEDKGDNGIEQAANALLEYVKGE